MAVLPIYEKYFLGRGKIPEWTKADLFVPRAGTNISNVVFVYIRRSILVKIEFIMDAWSQTN